MSVSKSCCFETKLKLEGVGSKLAQKFSCSSRKRNSNVVMSPVSPVSPVNPLNPINPTNPINQTNQTIQTIPISNSNPSSIRKSHEKGTTIVYGFDATAVFSNKNASAHAVSASLDSYSQTSHSPRVTSRLKTELLSYQKLKNDEILDRILPKIHKVKWNTDDGTR